MKRRVLQTPKYRYSLLILLVLALGLGGYGLYRILGSHSAGLVGDLNGDGTVNVTDLSVLASHYGQTATAAQGDLNGDGRVTIIDLSLLASNWGKTSSGSSNCAGVSAPSTSSFKTLKFCDDFSASLDKVKWAPVWFSDGATQNGTHMLAANVSVSGGYLNLRIDGSGNGSIVSSNPNASNGQPGYTGYQYSHGYAEARICLPAASDGSIANWPAWWTDGQNWPADGEQDVMEGLSGNARATWHDPSGGHAYGSGGHMTGCHIFASSWVQGTVTSYYDGVQKGSYSGSGVGSSPQYLIIENSNGQYGGTKVNNVNMQVDWVRVWQ